MKMGALPKLYQIALSIHKSTEVWRQKYYDHYCVGENPLVIQQYLLAIAFKYSFKSQLGAVTNKSTHQDTVLPAQ